MREPGRRLQICHDGWVYDERSCRDGQVCSASGDEARCVTADDAESDEVPANWDGNFRSYTNSLAVGNLVLVPVYSDDTRYQSEALDVFQAAYAGRTIIPLDSTDITWAGALRHDDPGRIGPPWRNRANFAREPGA